jgi:predicted RNA-binding protein YlqC (UPF0109 family)
LELAIVIIVVLAIVAILAFVLRRPGTKKSTPTRVVTLDITAHARQRMRERSVTEAMIQHVVSAPEREVATTYDDRNQWGFKTGNERDSVRLEGMWDGRVLKVWVPTDWQSHGRVIVKSVAWADVTVDVDVAPAAVGAIIGTRGATIKAIEARTGVTISRVGDARFRITAEERTAVEAARSEVAGISARARDPRGRPGGASRPHR